MNIFRLKNKWKIIFTFFGVLIFIIIFYNLFHNWNIINKNISIISPGNLVLSLVLDAIFFILLPIGWSLIFRKLNNNLPLGYLTMVYSKSQLVRYVPGGLWNYIGRVVVLKRCGISYDIILESFILESALLVLSGFIVGLFFLFQILAKIELILASLIIILLFFFFHKFNSIIRLFYRFLKKTDIKLQDINNKFFLRIFIFYIILWMFPVFGFAFFISSICNINFNSNLFTIGGIFPISWVFGFISPMPGGIGTREAALSFFMNRLGFGKTAYFISIASRILLMSAELISFLILLIAISRKRFLR